MKRIMIQKCGFCKTFFSNKEGLEFSGESPADLKNRKDHLENLGYKVLVITERKRPVRCPGCHIIKKDLKRGGRRSSVAQRRPHDADSDGSWGNTIKALED